MTKKKLIILISIMVVLAILIGVGIFALSGNKTSKIADKLDLGEKYLEELEYEKALAYFMEVLEIDPKNVDAYLGIADVYVAMGEHQKALEILYVGYQETGNEKMVEKFEEVEALMSSEADSMSNEEDYVIEGEKLPSSLYFVCIDGIQFNLPFKLSELEKVGFDLTECKGTMLEPGGETHYWLKKKDVSYIFYVYNQNETESNVMDAMVYSMGLSADDCAKVKFRTIGDIEYGSDMEFVNSVSLKYEGDSIEVDDGRTIFNFAENNILRQFYRIDVGPEGFAQYFEVYNRDASCLYGVDRVGRFMEYSPEQEIATTTEPTEETTTTEEPVATLEPAQEPEATLQPVEIQVPDDFVIDWKDSVVETAIRDVTGIYDRNIVYEDIKGITWLELGGEWDITKIKDISALRYFTSLEYLVLRYSAVKDISALSNLSNLKTLDLNSNTISDISALSGLTNLENLSMTFNAISDISSLENLTNLKSLSLSGAEIGDISVLSNLTNLEYLMIYNTSIKDISALSNLTKLETLYLFTNPISDIGALSNLLALRTLDLSNNQIADISALSNLTNLTSLYLNGNNISDISMLSNLTNLTILNLTYNQIADISALGSLTALESLYIEANAISDISALSNLKNLQSLFMSNNPIVDYSPVSHVPEVY